MGRPTKLTPDVEERILCAIRGGNYPDVAARSAGVHRSTFYRWLSRGDPDGKKASDGRYRAFRDSVEQASAEAETRDVTLIAEAGEKDWRAAAWRLERKHSARWARRPSAQADPPERNGAISLPSRDDENRLNLNALSEEQLELLPDILRRGLKTANGKAGEAQRLAYARAIWYERYHRRHSLGPEHRELAGLLIRQAYNGRSPESQAEIDELYDRIGERLGLGPQPR